MKEKLKSFILSFLLLFLWLIPLYSVGGSFDGNFIKSIVVYILFTIAAYLCYFLPNRHAALIIPGVLGVVICVLRPAAAFDTLSALLLCCWLRCYLEYKKGNTVTIYLELYTDLIYAYLVAALIRLIRRGYSFLEINNTDVQAVPDICLMVFVLLLFSVFFVFFKNDKAQLVSAEKKRKKTRRSEKKVVGIIPVFISLRTFWGLCVVILAVSLLQYLNSGMTEETFLFFRSGFRLLFLPWIVLLFFVFDAFLSEAVFRNRLLRR